MFWKVQKTGGKGENVGYHHFSPFHPNVFRRLLFQGRKVLGLRDKELRKVPDFVMW